MASLLLRSFCKENEAKMRLGQPKIAATQNNWQNLSPLASDLHIIRVITTISKNLQWKMRKIQTFLLFHHSFLEMQVAVACQIGGFGS